MNIEMTPNLLIPTALHNVTDLALVEGVAEFGESVDSLYADATARVRAVSNDPKLSKDVGVPFEIAATGQKTALALMLGPGAKMRQLRDGITAGEAILAPVIRQRIPPNVDADDWRWAEREMRDKLDKLDPLQRESMYLDACARGDVQTIRAFELAPRLFPLVSDETIAKGAETYARNVMPDKWSILEQQRAVLAHYDATLNRATQALMRLAGIRVDAEAEAEPEPAGV